MLLATLVSAAVLVVWGDERNVSAPPISSTASTYNLSVEQRKIMEEKALAGDAFSADRLIYYSRFVLRDYGLAKLWARVGTDLGSLSAPSHAAFILRREGSDASKIEAVAYLLRAFEAHDRYAAFQIAEVLKEIENSKTPIDSVSWYKIAARHGSSLAMSELARIYSAKERIEDKREGLSWSILWCRSSPLSTTIREQACGLREDLSSKLDEEDIYTAEQMVENLFKGVPDIIN